MQISRIAMWSGPRNISTAMMRAWENRADTCVVDEPFYACYLAASGIEHPLQQEVLASQSSDWREVIEQQLQQPLADGQNIQYQKHMTHHMMMQMDTDWFASVKHAFLIRHPGEVVASYSAKRETVTAEDIGFIRQKELYDLAVSLKGGDTIPIIDASDVLRNPTAYLQALCTQLAVPFSEKMLHWPVGPRDSDGAWAPHWYNKVEQSTGFRPYQKTQINLDQQGMKVVEECLPYYQALFANRIQL